MDAAFTAEQDGIRRALRALPAARPAPDDDVGAAPPADGDGRDAAPPADSRDAAAPPVDGYDTELWRRLARDPGLPGLALPAEYGGAGRGPTGLAVACEETGRVLLPSPLIATAVLAAPLIAALGTGAQRAALLPRIASGELTAALAVPGGSLATALGLTGDPAGATWSGGGRAGGIQARAVTEDGAQGWRLYGEADRVLDGGTADVLLVAAHTGGFPRSRTLLFLVRPDAAAGLVRVPRTPLDRTRPQARLELRDTGAELLGADAATDVTGALAAAGQPAAALLAAEAVGAAAGALERTLGHLRGAGARPGTPGGQAADVLRDAEHRLADLYVRVQEARSAAYCAAWNPAAAGGLALAQALEVLRTTAAEAVQLPGGGGPGREDEARLYFGRAAAAELLFGPVHRLRDHAARRAGLLAQGTPQAARGPGAGPGPGAAERVGAV
ncbi:acyl-CoA dehydrogenase family protein [Streptomyces sp. NPDC058195]|uniref:acyl-CoA dehydrogenase family protein n=1 Tax=Streptomyces sp. NPDC058195 TaxID=3346375 RepID=UPI0036EA8E4F